MELLNALNQDTLFRMIIFIIILLIAVIIYSIYSTYKYNNQVEQYQDDIDETYNDEYYYEDYNDEDTAIIELNEISKVKKQNENFEINQAAEELKNIPRERTIKMTAYEAEQEERAIISYDELLSKTTTHVIPNNIERYTEAKEETAPNEAKQFATYEHEEAFLESLKQLNNMLN